MNTILHLHSRSLPRFESRRSNRARPEMTPLSATTDRSLRWSSLRWLKRDFELRSGDHSVGRLSFHSLWSYLATATSADGTWTFKRTGFWRPEIKVRVADGDADIAVFRYKTWEDGGSLEFRDGRTFRTTDKSWETRFEILSDRDEVVMSLRASAWKERSAEVELGLGAKAAKIPELSLLLLFGWYLAVLTRDEAAGA